MLEELDAVERENMRRTWCAQLRSTGLWRDSWMLSSDLPRVSGMDTHSTMTVARAKLPYRKYAPEDELARKIGVTIATSQLQNWSYKLTTVFILNDRVKDLQSSDLAPHNLLPPLYSPVGSHKPQAFR